MPITALGFLAVFTIGCLVALKRPFVGLLLYFFVFYMHPPGKYWGSFLPEMRWTLIVAVITLISTFINDKNKFNWLEPKESKLLVMLFIYVALQLTWVDFPSLHQVYVVLLFKLLVLYYLIIRLVNNKTRLLAVIVTNCIGAAYIGMNALQTHVSGRFEAAGLPGINDANLLAIHLVGIIFISSVIVITNLNRRYLIFIPLALVGNLFFMTGSRGGLVGLALAGLFFIWYSPKHKKTQILRWAFAAVILASFMLGPLIIDRIKQINSVSDTEQIDKSAYSRLVIIEGQWNMFKDYPILGFGHRGTLVLSPFYIDESYMTQTEAGARRASHNITLAFMVDHGLIGSSIFFLIIGIAVFSVRHKQKYCNDDETIKLIMLGASSGLVGVMVASQFSNSKVLEISMWLIALIVSCKLILKNAHEPKNELP